LNYYLGLIGFFIWMCLCNPQPVHSQVINRDTLLINDKIYFLDSIPESYYNSITDNSEITSIDTSIIKIYPNSITIKTSEKLVVLKNDTSVSESFKKYHYEGSFSGIGFVHILGYFWESSGDLLINLKNGNITFFWGSPKLSPDQSMIVSGNVDLGPMYMPNGIQLFQIKNSQIINVFETEIENWGPKEIKWESDSSIVIKRVKVDFAGGYKEYYDYRKMKIR
jgi:hypothetical protein